MLIYRAPRAVRVHTALAQSRRRLSSYRMSIALAAATIALSGCSSTSPKPQIGFNPQSITLVTVVGGKASGAVSVVNVTGSALSGLTSSVGAYTGNAVGWLTASLGGEATPTPLTLTADALNLSAGNYAAVVYVSSASASPPTASITVKLTVTHQ